MIISRVLFFILFLFAQVLSVSNVTADETNAVNNSKELDLSFEEEELPAIDPFQSSSAGVNNSSQQGTASNNPDLGLLGGLKLVAVIIGDNKRIAVLNSSDGFANNYEENDKINGNVELIRIFNDSLLVQDAEGKSYEVRMNDIIKEIKS
jgi:hypothetical protein